MKRPTPKSKQPATKPLAIQPLDTRHLRDVRGGDGSKTGGITASDDWESRM